MPHTLQHRAVRLVFADRSLACTDLSGAAFSGDALWVVGDESAAIELLYRRPPVDGEALHFAHVASFPLASVLDLPGAPEDEADLEGLAVDEGWLWLVGSHGLKRKNAKEGKDDVANARRLTKLSLDGNRRLLARVPIEVGDDGQPRLVREAADGRRAQRLKGDSERNGLIDVLAEDPHLAPFLAIPGKDNGFDIEGLAVDGERLLLGLRGPVLRGWTLLLEIAVAPHGEWLRLSPLDDAGTLVRKHFLALGGMGVRDLHFDGDDLFLLGGPTMVLDGDIRLFRWRGARAVLRDHREPVRFQHDVIAEVELPHSPGHDRAEAFCEVPAELVPDGGPAWLVLYDAPSPERLADGHVVFGDLLRR